MEPARVLIAGGGVAGLETALALRDLAGDAAEIEICAPRREFVYKPFAVGEPYGSSHVLRYPLEGLARRAGIAYRWSSLSSVDARGRQGSTPDGRRLSYDHLVIATGVKHLWSVPGATMFWGAAGELDAMAAVRGLGTSGLRHLVFAMPATPSWSLPLYELAFLAQARQSGAASEERPTRLTVVTPEESPLLVFGRQASDGVAELLSQSDIELVAGAHPIRFERGILSVAPGEGIEADAVISLPRLEGRRFDGVPHDEHGFIPIDDHCRVCGLERVYAAGDITTFPVKQGGIAGQQADVVAGAIAAELGCDLDAEPFDPILRGVLWTSTGTRYLYGRPTGGHGEVSTLTEEPPWPVQSGKIVSRYLSDFLAGVDRDAAAANPRIPAPSA
ncbi:MAG: NAD(P)/FAD-dependent oxidoreductase [Solirubrobacterales bacterium]